MKKAYEKIEEFLNQDNGVRKKELLGYIRKTKKNRPNKYESNVKPNLENIRDWVSSGITMQSIAKNLGISYGSLVRYRDIYPELDDIITTAHKAKIQLAKDKMFQLVTGYEEEREKTVIINGAVRKIKEKYYKDPSVTAGKFWLTNKCPEEFQNKNKVEVENVDKFFDDDE